MHIMGCVQQVYSYTYHIKIWVLHAFPRLSDIHLNALSDGKLTGPLADLS